MYAPESLKLQMFNVKKKRLFVTNQGQIKPQSDFRKGFSMFNVQSKSSQNYCSMMNYGFIGNKSLKL